MHVTTSSRGGRSRKAILAIAEDYAKSHAKWIDPTEPPYNRKTLQSCADAASGGVLFLPPNGGVPFTQQGGLTLGDHTTLIGFEAYLNPYPGDANTVTTLTADGVQIKIHGVEITGPDLAGTTAPTGDCLHITANCNNGAVSEVAFAGGSHALLVEGVDQKISDILRCRNQYGDRKVLFNVTGSAGITDSKLDQAYPINFPPAKGSTPAWASSAAVSLKEVRSLSAAWWIQCTKAGTTGSVAPTVQPFGVVISDGTAEWQLCSNINSAAVGFRSGGAGYLRNVDCSGAMNIGVAVTDPTGAAGSTSVQCIGLNTGNLINYGFYDIAGADLRIQDCIIGRGASSSSIGIYIGHSGSSAFSEIAHILNNRIQGFGKGIVVDRSGQGLDIAHNKVYGCGTAIELADAGIVDWAVTDNFIGAGTTWGANTNGLVTAAGIDYGIIARNNARGATTPYTLPSLGAHVIYDAANNL